MLIVVGHIKILAISHILWSLLWIVTTGMTVLILGAMLGVMVVVDDAELGPIVVIALLVLIIGLTVGIVALPGLVGGLGLLKGYGWARIPLFISALLSLSSFPYGFVLFGYTLVVLLDADVRRELAGA